MQEGTAARSVELSRVDRSNCVRPDSRHQATTMLGCAILSRIAESRFPAQLNESHLGRILKEWIAHCQLQPENEFELGIAQEVKAVSPRLGKHRLENYPAIQNPPLMGLTCYVEVEESREASRQSYRTVMPWIAL